MYTPEFTAFCADVWEEHKRADEKHGDWSGKHLTDCAGHVIDEALEVKRAAARSDIYGEHGIIRESVQTAATSFKMYRRVLA